MSDLVFECMNLSKFYKHSLTMNALTFSCKTGHIYGLVGAKGAGKTTLLQIITGLSFFDSGDFSLFGTHASQANLRAERRRIGALIDSPIFFDSMSGFQNLEYMRKLAGISDKDVSKHMLSLFGLESKKEIKVRYYTLAMKQRLGIACAMLSKPDFLVLDDPMNGLEPNEITELCNILQDINKEHNITMLITTSHAEHLYPYASDYLFLQKGKILQELTHQDLEQRCDSYITIETEDMAKTIPVLEELLPNTKIEAFSDNEIRIYSFMGRIERISSELQFRNLPAQKIEQVGLSVKDYLAHLTGGVHHA